MPDMPVKKSAPAGKPKPGAKAAEKTAPKPADKAEMRDVGAGEAGSVPAAIRLNDLVERVATALGLKKNEIRDVVSVTFSELASALDKGEIINLPTLGKLRVMRRRDLDTGAILTLKLRRGGGGAATGIGQKPAKVALVKPDEAG